MTWTLNASDLDDLARGAALLGTGGGGDPHVGRLLALTAIEQYGPITIIDPDELDDDAFVIPTAQMGAPTVVAEKLPAGTEGVVALRALEQRLGRTADATMPIECGGVNSMIPLHIAAVAGLPVVDADGMGRAFPELQMETFSVYGINGSPLALAGENGESAIIDTGADNKRMEDFARALTVTLGGVAHIAEYSMTGADVKRTAVPRTLTLALTVGRAIRTAREDHVDPLERLAEALAPTLYSHLRVLFRGKVTDVERRTVGGFTRGAAQLKAPNGSGMHIAFQNENLTAYRDGKLVCIVPDLICILEAETAEPITTEALRYGQRVNVIGISTPDMMRTPRALDTFGPRAFGLNEDYRPVEAHDAAEEALAR
ncbi:DUF917 domain-containing protein [Ornithinimicrobium cavernae]|uniref:DUF917 domain-containing protein n=1 Tax=Ornithinimicrobium cavernae TaxID=2666047 RepID=UPI000D698C52|nr:DUF917 domain-containing protein [Ornithinimicrobium cavernae]